MENEYCKICGIPLLHPDKPCPKCNPDFKTDNKIKFDLKRSSFMLMKYYDDLFKKPLLLSILTLIIVYLSGVNLLQEIIIYVIIGIFYTFKNKNIMTKEFKLKFALYYTILSTLGLIIFIVLGLFNPLQSVGIITSIFFLIIEIPLRALKRFICSYLFLLISNRISLLLVKVSDLKNWLKYTTKPLISLVEKPQYLIIIAILGIISHYIYTSIYYEKGDFKLIGKMGNAAPEIASLIPLDNGNIFILRTAQFGNKSQYNIFNFKNEKFTPVKDLKQEYGSTSEPNAIKLDNGKVLIVGSLSELVPNYKNKITYGELYDPITNKISLVGKNLIPTYAFGMAKLQDGRVLIAGGAGFDKKAQIFDPKTNKFYRTGSLNKGRIDPILFLLKNGKVLVFNNSDYIDDSNYTMELYIPDKGIFKLAGNLPENVGHIKKIFPLKNGKILFLSTANDYKNWNLVFYNPDKNEVDKIYTMPQMNNIDNFETTLLQNDKILFTGGIKNGHEYLSAEIFDPKTEKYTPINHKMRIPRAYHKAIQLKDGRVLILDGCNSQNLFIEQAEIFYPPKS